MSNINPNIWKVVFIIYFVLQIWKGRNFLYQSRNMWQFNIIAFWYIHKSTDFAKENPFENRSRKKKALFCTNSK